MNTTQVHASISAPPEKIWKIITDGKLLQNSDLGILKLEGQIQLGNKIKLISEVDPKRTFTLKVIKLYRCKIMVWRGGMPFGLFTGVRSFILSESNGGTDFEICEEFSGPLSGPICKSMPDLTPSFEKMIIGIKRLAEEEQL